MAGRSRIVIVGGGFAGDYCARALEKRLAGYPVELALINRGNFFVFTPFLVEAGTGEVEPRHTVVPLRAFLSSTRLHAGKARGEARSPSAFGGGGRQPDGRGGGGGIPGLFARSVAALTLPGLARKVRVATDWTLGLIFGRDVVQLGLAGLEREKR